MSIFKDLGFKKRNGNLVTPDTEMFNGYDYDSFKQTVKEDIELGGYIEDSDGLITINGSSLPATVNQDIDEPNWNVYQLTAKYPLKSNEAFDVKYVKIKSTRLVTYASLSMRFLNENGARIQSGAKLADLAQSATFENLSITTDGVPYSTNFWIGNTVDSAKNLEVPGTDTNKNYFLQNTANEVTSIVTFNNVTKLTGIVVNTAPNGTNRSTSHIIEFYNENDELLATLTAGYSGAASNNLETAKTDLIEPAFYVNDKEQTVLSEVSYMDKADSFNDGSIIAAYLLDDNVNDLTGNYNGTLDAPIFTQGQFSNAINTSDSLLNTRKVVLPNNMISGRDSYAISTWFHNNGLTATATRRFLTLTSDSTSDTEVQLCLVPTTRKFSILCKSSTGVVNSLSGTIDPNVNINDWTHYAVSVENNNPTVYINGYLLTFDSAGPTTSTRMSAIGGGYSPSSDYNTLGFSDVTRIFNRPLTLDEMKSLRAEGKIITHNLEYTDTNTLDVYTTGMVDDITIKTWVAA